MWAACSTPDAACTAWEANLSAVDVRAVSAPGGTADWAGAPLTTLATLPAVTVCGVACGEGEIRGKRIVLLGNAAHGFPPDTRQGVAPAIKDAAVLAKVLRATVGAASAAGGDRTAAGRRRRLQGSTVAVVTTASHASRATDTGSLLPLFGSG